MPSPLPKEISEFLNEPYPLTKEQIRFYDTNRFIKLKNVFNPPTLEFFREVIDRQVERMNKETRELSARDTYGKAFLQLFNLWTQCTYKGIGFQQKVSKNCYRLNAG